MDSGLSFSSVLVENLPSSGSTKKALTIRLLVEYVGGLKCATDFSYVSFLDFCHFRSVSIFQVPLSPLLSNIAIKYSLSRRSSL